MFLRFMSWIAIGVAAAFLVIATTTFSLFATKWLTFGIGLGTLAVSLAVGYGYRQHIPTLVTTLVTAIVSVWTVIASQVFSMATVQTIGLASGLMLAALAIIGVTAHELSNEDALMRAGVTDGQRESRLATAA